MEFREQARRDVDRTKLSKEQKPVVLDRICTVLEANPDLHYYQGYHDVAALCATDGDLEELSLQCLRDFMTPTLEPTLKVLALVPELARVADARLGAVMKRAPEPHFALAPLLTLFAHDTTDRAVLETVQEKVRQYGLGYIIYLYTVVLVARRDAIVEQTTDEPAEVVHSVLSRLGGSLNGLEPDTLFRAVDTLRVRYPLSKLPAFRKLSRHSALKTGPHISEAQARRSLQELSHPRSSGRRLAFTVAIVVFALFLQRRRP